MEKYDYNEESIPCVRTISTKLNELGVEEKLTPFGFFLPEHDDLFLFFTLGYVSSDFIVDRLEEIWPVIHEEYGADILTINTDNGMENSSSRTQLN